MSGLSMPDQFILQPTEHSPNSPLPILLYRNVLPQPYTEATTTKFLEANDWEKRVSRLPSTSFTCPEYSRSNVALGHLGPYIHTPLSSKFP